MVVTTSDNTTYEADKVLVTVPIKVLQDELIEFAPTLPSAKVNAINQVYMGDGLKVFIEFSEKFYPDLLSFGNVTSLLTGADDRLYYDAAFRKDSNRHILGLFTVQSAASMYTNLGSDQAIIDFVLAELDEIFDNKASETYLNHVIQNWSAEPFVRGSYSYDFDGDTQSIMNTILEPVANKLFFAGEALNLENQSTVHGASESAYQVIRNMLTS